jgi:hypothetical protein
MQLFSEYVQWQNFAATEFALAEVQEERAEASLKRIIAEQMILINPGKGQVMSTKAGLAISPVVERAEQERLNTYANRKLTGVMRDNCERTSALLSRELSRRIGGADVQRRSMRWQP